MTSECIRCNTYDGFSCLVGVKADGELDGIRPALKHKNVKLNTGAYVSHLSTSASGREISGVETIRVLDLNCRTQDVDHLYGVDSSLYPSSALLNPIHTLLANALRVGDRLLERL